MRAGGAPPPSADMSPGPCRRRARSGVKVINAGGVAAFKENVRSFSFDDVVPWYGVSCRQIVKTLQQAVHELGVPHPLHVHCNNLGMPGNFKTALATIGAAEGLPLHLAHLQFYGYGAEGEQGILVRRAAACRSLNAAQERDDRRRAGRCSARP